MVNIAQTQKIQLIKIFSSFGLPGELAYCILGTWDSLHRNLCKTGEIRYLQIQLPPEAKMAKD